LSVIPIQPIARLKITPLGNMTMHADIAEIRFPLGAVVANCSSESVEITARFSRLQIEYPSLKLLRPYEVKVFYSNEEAKRLEILTPIPQAEHYGLFFGQAKILLREHLFLGRKISVSAYLENTGKVEDQTNW
jgi:hypothetical protein